MKYLLPCLMMAAVFSSCSSNKSMPKSSDGVKLASQEDSVSYAIGVLMATNMKTNVDTLNIDAYYQGFKAKFTTDSAMFDMEQANEMVQTYMQAKEEAKNAPLREAGEKFLAENAKREGVVVLPSGLQYEIIEDASGPKPEATQEVSVHYTGTLIDGSVFDSSVERGEPAQFPLNRVISGWTEGLQLMSPGAKYKFYIPYNLGYGPQGNRGIPPYATLIFEVELLEIL